MEQSCKVVKYCGIMITIQRGQGNTGSGRE